MPLLVIRVAKPYCTESGFPVDASDTSDSLALRLPPLPSSSLRRQLTTVEAQEGPRLTREDPSTPL